MRSRLLIAVLIFAPLLLGSVLRSALGVDELSLDGVRAAVEHLGRFGPMLFFGLVVFRQVLAIPALLVLATGGVCFGAALGTVLGATGIMVSGAAKFWIARWAGREWVRTRMGERFQRFDERVDRLGPIVIGLSTAHPFGVLAPFHWGAGLSSLSFPLFAVALVLGAPVRAFALSMLGASIADSPSREVWLVVAGITFALALPFFFPAVRRRLFLTD